MKYTQHLFITNNSKSHTHKIYSNHFERIRNTISNTTTRKKRTHLSQWNTQYLQKHIHYFIISMKSWMKTVKSRNKF